MRLFFLLLSLLHPSAAVSGGVHGKRLSPAQIIELYGEQPLLTELVHLRQPGLATNQSLREAANGTGVLMGAESAFYYFSDPHYQPTLYEQYEMTEPENECSAFLHGSTPLFHSPCVCCGVVMLVDFDLVVPVRPHGRMSAI